MSVIEAPPEKKSFLEIWSTNERMRHVPAVSWMLQKIDGDVRRRIGLLLASASGAGPDDSRSAAVDAALRALCRALERVGDVARQGRSGSNGHPPQELGPRIQYAIELAVSSLRGVDAELVGRRYPVQTFERSKAEPLWAALLLVIDSLHKLTAAVRPIDARIDERLYEPLVTLQQPMDPRAMA